MVHDLAPVQPGRGSRQPVGKQRKRSWARDAWADHSGPDCLCRAATLPYPSVRARSHLASSAGKSLADSLSLPASSARREVLTDIAFFGMQVPILFGRFYPRRSWEKRKLELSRPLMRRLIDWSFGNKRTRFEMPSRPMSDTPKKGANAEKINVETQNDSHIDVPDDKDYFLGLAREWRWLMREMIAVFVFIACVVAALTVAAYSQLRHRFASV